MLRTKGDKTKKKPDGKEKNISATGGKVIAVCILLLILLMAVTAAVASVFDIPLFNLGNKSADGKLIYAIDSAKVKDMQEFSSGAVILTDSSVEYFEESGKRIAANSHMYAQPVMKSNGKTVLVYDKGGTVFRLERNAAVYNTYNVSAPIVTASVGKKHNYAYVLSDDAGYQSHLYVYSYQGKKQFEWGSASDYCLTTALSDNGKSIALAMIGVNNGEYLTKVSWFDFKASAAVFTVELPDITVFELKIVDNKQLVALTDNGIFAINKDGTYSKISEYLSNEIMYADCRMSGFSAVSIARHGNPKDSVITVFDKKFEELFTLEIPSEVNVCTSKSFVAVLMNGIIEIYNEEKEKTAEIVLPEKCIRAVFSGRTLFVETVSGIYSFDAYTNADITQIQSESTAEAPLLSVLPIGIKKQKG